VILRESGSPQPGSYLAFLVRIKLSTPRHLKMPDAPANEAGVLFIFEGGSQEVRLWHLADMSYCTANVRFRGQSGRRTTAMSAYALSFAVPKSPGISARRCDTR
jgi:hypothetical protein